jgi:hypothetical protein
LLQVAAVFSGPLTLPYLTEITEGFTVRGHTFVPPARRRAWGLETGPEMLMLPTRIVRPKYRGKGWEDSMGEGDASGSNFFCRTA